jgi:hypothetical protein
MTTLTGFHEVEDGNKWANAWKKGPGSRHEMFAKIGAKVRTFRDPKNHNLTGVVIELPDVRKFDELMNSAEGKKAVAEDGLKLETLRVLEEFTP